MDLNSWSRFWCLNVVLLVFINGRVLSGNQCSPGLSMPGYTVPHGDIIIEYGNPLDITCVLYETAAYKQGPNSSLSLNFSRGGKLVPSEMVDVINSTSIRLHVDKPPKVTSDSYTCLLNLKFPVCMNTVSVGTKPQQVTDFQCVGYNYDNLTCSWTPPDNHIKTDYNLTFTLRGRASRYVNNACPRLNHRDVEPKMSCFWNISTTPQYRQAHQEFYFSLTMTNVLGRNQLNKTFKHFEHVLSGPPENLTVVSKTPSSIYLYWMVPSSMQSFPAGVHHRVLYQCEFGEKIWHFGGLITNSIHSKEIKFNLTGLKYAHALYDIRVAIRSAAAAANDETMWSRNSSTTIRTSSKVPDEPPQTNVGSFEIVAFGNNLQYREAYIYWKQILEEQRNGPDFKYVIVVEGDESVQPTEITHSYAKFKNLSISKSYKFNIWSGNSAGRSHQKSTIVIPKQTNRLSEPLSFTKVEYGDGRHELTWEPPKLMPHQIITNYTLFWCNNDRDRPYQCNGKLNWVVVPSDKTSHNETVPKDKIYQFAIAANTRDSTSGMLWAACTVIHNKNMGKMKNVWINRLGSTFIEVGWKLDCSNRIGSVEGYIVYYCPILSPIQTECKGPQKNETFYGDTSVLGGNIPNLTPYTTYMLTVSVITKHTTFSQQSDPLFNTTLEAAPSTPPLDFTCTEVTNSSITLTWLPPKATNGVLKYYYITVNDERKKIDPTTNITLVNLASYENYLIAIQACTTLCSNMSQPLSVQTKMGYPGKINRPSVIFQNDSYVIVSWDKPSQARGINDYYEVQVKQKHDRDNKTIPLFNVTSSKYNIENCGDGGKYNTFYVAVRAVNLFDGLPHEGPWSEELQSYCRAPVNYLVWILPIIGILFFLGMAYLFNRLYKHCKIMRDVEVKLPPGLAPVVSDHTLVAWSTEKHLEDRDHRSPADEELLLEKMSEGRHLSGDSSGCSSGHESVTSSLESGTHISSTSDSGTEQPPDYCVDPVLKLSSDSSYVPVSSSLADASQVPYISCDASSQPSPYVMAEEVVKSVNPGYIAFNQLDQLEKRPGYVVAGLKNVNGYIPFNQTESAGYVVAGVNKNCKLD